MNASTASHGFAVFKHRDFAFYMIARFASAIATQMIVIAVGWQVYRLTGRVLDLGLIGLSQFLPFLVLSLISGHVADRYDRRLIISTCLSVFLLCALLLWWSAVQRVETTWPIFSVLALLGIARAFLQPATQSFLPNVVPLHLLGNAVAMNSSAFQVANIAGPSVGGLVYAMGEAATANHGGAEWVYGISAGLLALGVSACLSMRTRWKPSVPRDLSWASLSEGVHFVWRRKTVLGAISLDLFAVLFGGATALLPAYTREVLHAGPEVFGYLRAAPGIGAAVTAGWLAFKPVTRRVGRYMFTGVAMFGMATIVYGMTTRFWVAMVALVLLGAGDMISVFIRMLLVQLETPDAIRGRVSAVNAVFIGASNELGEFESGFTAAWFGLVPAIVAGGVVTLVVTVLWARVLFPQLWRLDSFDQLEER